MELKQLLYFKTVAECNNMSRAAEKLHVSQPALSAAVKKLENELETCLFERRKNNISLNAAGKKALTCAESVLGAAEKMKDAFKQDRLTSLGFCDPGPMRFSVPLFQKAFPNINVTSEVFADESDLPDLLRSLKYDAVISLQNPQAPDIETVPFAFETLLLSVPKDHPWARRTSVCLHEESDFDIAVYCGSGAYIRRLRPLLDWLVSRHSAKIYDDYFVFKQLLEQKNILTLTTRLVKQYRSDGDGRIFIPLRDEGISEIYQLSYLTDRKKHVAPFLKWATENASILLK